MIEKKIEMIIREEYYEIAVEDLKDVPNDYDGIVIVEGKCRTGDCRTEYIATGDGKYYRPRS